MKRNIPGGFKPRNTLSRPGPGANTLSTITSRGLNVSAESNKRRKIDHDFPEDAEDIPDDRWFDRDVQGQSPVDIRRQPSVISVNSQETHSQKSNPFGYEESRNVYGVMNYSKKKGRKPKTGTAQHSSPHRQGAETDPVSVEDDDDIQFITEQHNTPRPTHYTAVARIPRSPTLQGKFVRDYGDSDLVPEARKSPSKIRSKMQSASNTSKIMQPAQVVEDSSEDELSREPAVQSSVRKIKKTVRSPSPNDITSTHFASKRRKSETRDNPALHLSQLRMMAGNWEDLYLIYSWTNKVVQFNRKGEMLRSKGDIIQLTSIHAQTVYCDVKSSTAVILSGAKGGMSSGRILCDFTTLDDRNTFLQVVDHMNPKGVPRKLDP